MPKNKTFLKNINKKSKNIFTNFGSSLIRVCEFVTKCGKKNHVIILKNFYKRLPVCLLLQFIPLLFFINVYPWLKLKEELLKYFLLRALNKVSVSNFEFCEFANHFADSKSRDRRNAKRLTKILWFYIDIDWLVSQILRRWPPADIRYRLFTKASLISERKALRKQNKARMQSAVKEAKVMARRIGMQLWGRKEWEGEPMTSCKLQEKNFLLSLPFFLFCVLKRAFLTFLTLLKLETRVLRESHRERRNCKANRRM